MIDRRSSARGRRLAELDQGIEDRRAACRLDVLDGLDDGSAIAGGPREGGQLLGEWRNDHGIARPEKRGQTRRRVLHEIKAPRHALAAVDQQRERRRDALVAHQIDRLRDVILLDDEISRRQTADEVALLVVNPGLEQDACDLGDLGDLECLEHDLVAPLVAVAILDLDAQLTTLERIFVGPLHGVRRPIVIGLVQGAVDEEANRAPERSSPVCRSAPRCGRCRRCRCVQEET